MAKRDKNDAGDAGTTAGEPDPNGRLANQAETEGKDQSTSQLGEQVRPETQLDEDNGNRTLSRPRTDPGPTVMQVEEDGEGGFTATGVPSEHILPHRDNGLKPYHKLNPPLTVTRRVSTTPEHFAREPVTADHKMSADHAMHAGASDMYHPEGRNGDGRDPVRERAEREREIAPKSASNDPFARASEPEAA